MEEEFWSLPGPRRYLRDVAEQLQRRVSAVCFVPSLAPTGLEEAVREAGGRRSRRLLEVSVEDIASIGAPLTDALFEDLGLDREPGVPLRPDHAAAHPQLQGSLLLFDGRTGERSWLSSFASFLRDFARAGATVDPLSAPRALVLWPGTEADLAPPLEPGLSHHWWWGQVSKLDTAIWVAEHSYGSQSDPCEAGAIIELAGFDLELADELLAQWRGDLDCIGEILERYAKERGLNLPEAAEIHALTSSAATGRACQNSPPTELRSAWDARLVEQWSGSVVVHSAVFEQHSVELRRRVWTAQVRELFPVLEIERQRLASWLASHAALLQPCSDPDDVEAFELGPMAKVLGNSPKVPCSTTRRGLSRWLAASRNRLAHLSVLDAKFIAEGRQLIERDRRQRS